MHKKHPPWFHLSEGSPTPALGLFPRQETTNTDELWDLFDIDDSGCIDQATQLRAPASIGQPA